MDNNREYEKNLKSQAEKKKYTDAAENIREFLSKNGPICSRALLYYEGFKKHRGQYVSFSVRGTADELKKALKQTTILVITANPIEEGVFLRWLAEKNGCPLSNIRIDGYNYCFSTNYDDTRTIIHVRTKKTGEEYARRLLNNARKVFRPNYILMLGICYGLSDMRKFPIGTVFLSDSITSFRLNFRDCVDSDEITFEAEDEFDEKLDEDFVSYANDRIINEQTFSIVSETDDPYIVRTEMGKFLSCNSLMDSSRVKRAVLEQYSKRKPKPLGGEMEGAGFFKSSFFEEDGFDKWMIIKSICDWGEKKNSIDPDPEKSERIKDSLQAFAMCNTCATFSRIFPILQ